MAHTKTGPTVAEVVALEDQLIAKDAEIEQLREELRVMAARLREVRDTALLRQGQIERLRNIGVTDLERRLRRERDELREALRRGYDVAVYCHKRYGLGIAGIQFMKDARALLDKEER